MRLHREYLKSENAKNFSEELDNNNVCLNSFIKLLNLWSNMSPEERGECIDYLSWR